MLGVFLRKKDSTDAEIALGEVLASRWCSKRPARSHGLSDSLHINVFSGCGIHFGCGNMRRIEFDFDPDSNSFFCDLGSALAP